MTNEQFFKAITAALGPVRKWGHTVVGRKRKATGSPWVYRSIGVGWARTDDGHLYVFVWED